jgi:outer membrane protein assembly factor BamB
MAYKDLGMNHCCPFARIMAALALLAALGAAWIGLGGLYQGLDAGDADKAPRKKTTPRDAWTMFGGTPSRNMANPTDKGVPTDWKVDEQAPPEGNPLPQAKFKNIKWMARVGSGAYGGPVIAGGKVFVGTNNDRPRDPRVKGNKAVLMCFRESDGKFLWQLAHPMPDPSVAREALKYGLCSTPAIEGERIYYVTPACVVVCATTAGKVVWSFDMMKKLDVYPCYINSCSPLVVGDHVFVVTANGRDGNNEVPSPKAPNFVAFDKKTGEPAWKYVIPGKNLLEGQWSNPAFGMAGGRPQVLFPGGDSWLYSFDPKSGKLLWKFDCNPKGAVWGRGARWTRNLIVATPVIHDGKVYVGTGLYPDHPGGSGPGYLWCVDMTKNGDVSEEVAANGGAGPAKGKPNPNSALVWKFGGPIKPQPESGREVFMGRTISTVAIEGGLVYLAEYAGYLHCLDAKTGKKYWEHDFKTGIWGSPYWVDGKVYIGNDDSDMFVFAAGKKEKQIAQIEMGEMIQSTPVSANGVLYVLTKTKLYAIGK